MNILRQRFLDEITPFIDNELIKVITGIRRSGKTQVLYQIQDIIKNRGVLETSIININFESMRFKSIRNSEDLYSYISGIIGNSKEKFYIFLDEIQNVSNWEEAVNSFRVDFNSDIYITGSNSKLLSGELASNLAGRYVSFEMYPFSFKEVKEYAIQKGTFTTNEALFQDYLKYGGFPQRFQFDNENMIYLFFEDLYNSIVLKDIIERNKIQNVHLLERLCNYVLDNVGLQFSATSIANKIKSERMNCTIDTVLNYIKYIQNAYIIQSVKRYDITGKKLLEINEKYYSMDVGLCSLCRTSEKIDVSKIYENIVYLELCSRGYKVHIGKLEDKEIDFIAYKGNKKLYIQVAYLINDHDIEREFGNLRKLNDNFPKYVISSDLVDLSQSGIIHKNIIQWLLE